MARVKRGTKARARRKRTMNVAEGFRGRRKNCFTLATVAVDKALQYAYVGRKQRKRNFRSLWVERINAAARSCGVSYSKLVPMLKKAGIEIDINPYIAMAIYRRTSDRSLYPLRLPAQII